MMDKQDVLYKNTNYEMVKTEMKCFISSSEIHMHISKLQVWVLYLLKNKVETFSNSPDISKGEIYFAYSTRYLL